jgi:hypothetical protein
METKTVTNWSSWQEWKSVIDDAYNEKDDINMMRRAFSRICTWQARDSTDLPTALVCLKELLSAKLNIIVNKATTSIDKIHFYQSGLAMNIVRFVNFITEPYQDNLHAKPVRSIANMIGLPDWIVNLRHNATHYNLPSLEILETARDYLFQWLNENYVKNYNETTLEYSIANDVKFLIRNLLDTYVNLIYKLNSQKNKDKSVQDTFSNLTQQIEMAIVDFRNETFDILLEDGYFIPSSEQFNAIGIIIEEYIEQTNLLLPKQTRNIWINFLTFCNENNFIGLFFHKLISTYKSEVEQNKQQQQQQQNIHCEARRKFLLSWILYLIKTNEINNNSQTKSPSIKFTFDFKYRHVLLDILKVNVNRFTLIFLQEVSKTSTFSSEIDPTSYDKLLTLTTFVSLSNEKEKLSEDDNDVNSSTVNETITYSN